MKTLLFIALTLILSVGSLFAHTIERSHNQPKDEDWSEIAELSHDHAGTVQQAIPAVIHEPKKVYDWAAWKWKIIHYYYTERHTHLPLDAPPPAPAIANMERRVIGMIAKWYGFPNTIRGIERLREAYPSGDSCDDTNRCPWQEYLDILRTVAFEDRNYCPKTYRIPGGCESVPAAPVMLESPVPIRKATTTWAALKAR